MDQTSVAQLDWEDHHGRKAAPLIPEDLKESHAYFVDKMLNHVSVALSAVNSPRPH